MAITASSKGDGFEVAPIPQDIHIGRCVGMYDIGTQYNEKWKKSTRKVVLSFELPEVRLQFEKEDGTKIDTPRVASKEYGLSLHKKANLRADLVSWRGKDFTAEEEKGFDITKILGQPVMVTITHKEGGNKKIYSNISALGKPHKSIKFPKQELESLMFSFEDCESYEEMMEVIGADGFPEWIRKKIEQSSEYKALKERAAVVAPPAHITQEEPAEEDDDNPPF